MSNEDLLSIGAFAMWTGLSINALRHYDEIGLLKPASTDQATGYRRYQRAQIRQAKLICALRAIDLPIDAVRQVLDGPDGQLSTVLRLHRKQLLDQAHALTQ